jgi:formylglycine-generating enzyme required for sulfatase activity
MRWFATQSLIGCAILLALMAAACTYVPRETRERLPDLPRWTNRLGMVFVPVPGTRVRFSIRETRVRDFAAFAASNPELDGTNWNHALYHNVTPATPGPDYPVVNVSWNDANAFCAWLTETERKAGGISAGATYRLPTDAEWSRAAGIGDRETNGTPKDKNDKIEGVFPWGTQYPPPAGAGNFADLAAREYFTNWPCIEGYRDGFVGASPVGSFKPNDLGLYDLAGNAAEWVEDSYDGVSKRRELRGGGWNNTGPKSLWSSDRMAVAPERFSVVTGFRCVLAPGPKTPNPEGVLHE